MTWWRLRLAFALAAAALLCAGAGTARAEDGDGQARARELFEQGVAAARAGAHDDALAAFAGSYRLFPHPGTLMNLALYQEGRGRLVEAYRSFTELLDRFGAVVSAEARAQAEAHQARLAQRLALVTIRAEPAGAGLALDGEELGVAPLAAPVPVEPGPHRLVARLSAYRNGVVDLVTAPGERPVVTVELAPVPRDPPSAAVADAPPPADPRAVAAPSRRRRSFWRGPGPWVVGGAVLLVAAAALTAGVWPDDDRYAAEHTFP